MPLAELCVRNPLQGAVQPIVLRDLHETTLCTAADVHRLWMCSCRRPQQHRLWAT